MASYDPERSDHNNPAPRRRGAGRGLAARPRGGSRRAIDEPGVLDAVERLIAERGLAGVSMGRVAREIAVSRATLYRMVPSKGHLVGLVFQRMTDQLTVDARKATEQDGRSSDERLRSLLRVQIEAAIRTREYMFMFFGAGLLPREFYDRWSIWRCEYEQIWIDAVTAAAAEDSSAVVNPVLRTRLLLGMTIWVSRWFRPGQGITARKIAEEAIGLLNTQKPSTDDVSSPEACGITPTRRGVGHDTASHGAALSP